MVQTLVLFLLFFIVIYYIDIVGKLFKDERENVVRYKGIKLLIPFSYWVVPIKNKPIRKKKNKVKSKQTSNEKK